MNETIQLNTIELIEDHAFGYIDDEEMATLIEEYEDEIDVNLINNYLELSEKIASATLTEDEEVFIYDLYAEGYLETEVYTSLVENKYINSERASMLLNENKSFDNTDNKELEALLYRYSIIKAL